MGPLRFLVYSTVTFIKSVVFGQRVSADVTRVAKSCARKPVSTGGSGSIESRFSYVAATITWQKWRPKWQLKLALKGAMQGTPVYLTWSRWTHRHTASLLIRITCVNTNCSHGLLFWALSNCILGSFGECNYLLDNSIIVWRLSIVVTYCRLDQNQQQV